MFILILALVLRLVNLNQSLWLDEAVQAITAKGPFLGLFSELRGDFHPPLYHLLMWLWVRIFGLSEMVLRLPSVIFGVATVWVVYKIVRSWELGIGRIAAIFLATAPFHIYYSQEARPYALVAFLVSLSWYYFASGTKKHQLGIGYILVTTLALYASYYTFLIIFSQGLIFFWRKKYSQLVYLLLPLLLFLPWLPMFFAQLRTGAEETRILPEWRRLVNLSFFKALPLTFVKFSLGRITIFNKKIYALVAGVVFIIYGGIFGRSLELGMGKKKWDERSIFNWLVIPVFIAWLMSIFIPNYQPFRLLFVLPAFYLILALGISKFKNKKIQTLLVIFILAINLSSWLTYAFNPFFHREDWRGLVKYIETTTEQGRLAILPSDSSNWPWKYYSQNKVKLITATTGVNKVADNWWAMAGDFKEARKIYYIRYLVPLFDPQEKISSWLTENAFVKIKEVSFNQIPVWVYEKEKEKYAHRN